MAGLRQWLVTTRPTWAARCIRVLMRVVGLPYAVVMRMRNWAYDRELLVVHRLAIPVICIGNLTVGGTGKTPMVAWLSNWLRQHDKRVAIVSRGYGQLASGSNDEALELELRLPDVPHLQNPDRYAAALLAQDELDMEVVVLDDGFQHRRLGRSLDIVILDASDPPAAYWPLPGGLMREGWSGLKRAGVVLLSRTHLASRERLAALERQIASYAPGVPVIRTWHEPRGLHGLAAPYSTIVQLNAQRVLAFCGVGNPDSFFAMLRQQGVVIVEGRSYPDHHAYSAIDVEELQRWAAQHAQCVAIVCTMKDWVKLQMPRMGNLPLLALEIEVMLAPTDRIVLEQRLLEVMERGDSEGRRTAINKDPKAAPLG